MAKMKKTGLMDGAGSEDDYKYDPEGEEETNAGKYRLRQVLHPSADNG